MLSSLNLPLLQTKRAETTLYKIINGHLIVPTDDLIPKPRTVGIITNQQHYLTHTNSSFFLQQ